MPEKPRAEETLTRETIIKALAALNDLLMREDVRGEICLFGGSVMVLAFNARLSTKDVDAVFIPSQKIRDAATTVGAELNLESGWLNDGVKGFLSNSPTYTEEDLPQFSHLNIYRPTAKYLLAMKCMAARTPAFDTRGDREDIILLAAHLGITTPDEVLEIVDTYYQPAQIQPKTQFLIQEIFPTGK